MNKRMIIHILGVILMINAGIMVLPLITAIIYSEPQGWYFFYTIIGSFLLGLAAVYFCKPKIKKFYAKDGLVAVALSWIVLSLVGAVPFAWSGEIPSYVDALFEIISGYTTTGSSILRDIEALSHCMLFWRSFSHWIGGMGVLVFMMAIMRFEGGQSIHILRAESPGPSVSKIAPRMVDSSKILYGIYIALSLLLLVLYLIGGMPLFDALCHTFGTAGTGGFSVKGASMGAYSRYNQIVSTVFMLVFGTNFSVYYFIIKKRFDAVKKNSELRWYIVIVVVSSLLITLNVMPLYSSFGDALHQSSFAVSTVMSTTGYCVDNFDLWPTFSKLILCFLMVLGASAGSTGGGIKVSRLVIVAKSIDVEIRRIVNPRSVKVPQMDGKPLSTEYTRSVANYTIAYVLVTLGSFLLISLDGFDLTTTVTSVLATFNNIGPGLAMVGPVGNYADFSALSKIVLCIDMLLGRLEIYPMLILMLPMTWKRK